MRYILIISLFVLTACSNSKEVTSQKKVNCPPAILEPDEPLLRTDTTNNWININDVDYTAGYLKFYIEYSGGCKTHNFQLIKKIDTEKEKFHSFYLFHNTNGDNCRERIADTLCFDASSAGLKPGDTFLIEGFSEELKAD